MAFHNDDICFHALLEMEHEPGSPPARQFAGSVVNAWTFASTADAARSLMIEVATPRFYAASISITTIEPADPGGISEDESLDQLRQRFQRERVIFATPVGWPRKHWWQFWRTSG